MKKNRHSFIAAAFVILVLGTFTIAGCGRTGAADKSEGKKAVYACPMHPSYTSDKPGDCIICGMKLVNKGKSPARAKEARNPSEERTLGEICIEHDCTMKDCPMMHVRVTLKPGEKIICPVCGEYISTENGKFVEAVKPSVVEKEGPTVMISKEKQQLIGVKTEAVRRMPLAKAIRASGKIAYDPELVITQEEFIQALNNEKNIKDSPLQDVIDRAKALTEAARRKLKLLGMSEDQIAGIEKTRKAQTNLYLPGKGENVWAYVSIYEYEIGLVKQDDAVEIEAVAYPGEKFTGKIISINPVLDPVTRTNLVRVEVENTGDKLKPEMFINAGIKILLGEKLAVPESAVLDTGMRKIVYLSKEGDILESREVTLGQKAEGYYEVLDGLEEGDIVVTSGNFLVDSETRLKSAISGQEHKHGE